VLRRLHVYRLYSAVLVWLAATVVLLLAAAGSTASGLWFAAVGLLLAPVLLMALRRRSLSRGVYAVVAWLVFAAGMVRGAWARPRRSPTDPVRFEQLQ
jgi:hypothetical protein